MIFKLNQQYYLSLKFMTKPVLRVLSLLLLTVSMNSYAVNLSVYKVVVPKGSISDQPLSVLDTFDQVNEEDNWSVYLEASPSEKRFVGLFYFKQPVGKSWEKLKVYVNTLGEESSSQRWKFQIRDFLNEKWVTLGDNSNASGWVWHDQVFHIDADVSNFINAKNYIKIRYLSNNNVDVSNIDQFVVELIEDFSGTGSSTDTDTNTGSGSSTNTGSGSSTDTDTNTGSGSSTDTDTNTGSDSSTDSDAGDSTDPTDWWMPTPDEQLTWQWQINGNLNTSLNVDMYDVDLFDTSASQIAALKNSGKVVVCYFSAGTYEGWRDDWRQHFSFINSDSYSGNEPPFASNMSDWDERWLDIRRIDLLTPIMQSRMALAKAKGCDAVEPDNMDAYTNGSETGIPLTAADQLAYNKWIAKQAHLVGLSVGLKNDVDQLDELVDHFDWALNEQCFQYNECEGYSAFTSAGKAVFGVEYSGSSSNFCAKAKTMKLSWLKKKLSLDAWREGCEDY